MWFLFVLSIFSPFSSFDLLCFAETFSPMSWQENCLMNFVHWGTLRNFGSIETSFLELSLLLMALIFQASIMECKWGDLSNLRYISFRHPNHSSCFLYDYLQNLQSAYGTRCFDLCFLLNEGQAIALHLYIYCCSILMKTEILKVLAFF